MSTKFIGTYISTIISVDGDKKKRILIHIYGVNPLLNVGW